MSTASPNVVVIDDPAKGHVINNVNANPALNGAQGSSATSDEDSDVEIADAHDEASPGPEVGPSSEVGLEGGASNVTANDGGQGAPNTTEGTSPDGLGDSPLPDAYGAPAVPPGLGEKPGVNASAPSHPTQAATAMTTGVFAKVPLNKWDSNILLDKVREFNRQAAEKAKLVPNTGKTRGVIAAALQKSGKATVYNGAPHGNSLADQYSLLLTLAPGANSEYTQSMTNMAQPVAIDVYREVIKTFNEMGVTANDVPVTLERLQGGYVAVCKDFKLNHYGWELPGLHLSDEDDNRIVVAKNILEELIGDCNYPLTVERVAHRDVAPLRAFYFFPAPEGAIDRDGRILAPIDRAWFQSFADEFVRQFPEAFIKKAPIWLHPKDHPDLRMVYLVAEINFVTANHHLRDVSFNVNPLLSAGAPTPTITAHFSMGDKVCFQCLHNGHMKSNCDPNILRPSRDIVGVPHEYPELPKGSLPKTSHLEPDDFVAINSLSPFTMPPWIEKANSAREQKKKAQKESELEILAEAAKSNTYVRSSLPPRAMSDFQCVSHQEPHRRQKGNKGKRKHDDSPAVEHSNPNSNIESKNNQSMFAGLKDDETLEDPDSSGNSFVSGATAKSHTNTSSSSASSSPSPSRQASSRVSGGVCLKREKNKRFSPLTKGSVPVPSAIQAESSDKVILEHAATEMNTADDKTSDVVITWQSNVSDDVRQVATVNRYFLSSFMATAPESFSSPFPFNLLTTSTNPYDSELGMAALISEGPGVKYHDFSQLSLDQGETDFDSFKQLFSLNCEEQSATDTTKH